MSIPQVTVLRPRSLDELGAVLRQHGEDARVYAGATELVVAMKLGLTDAQLLVDLKGIPELGDVMVDDDRIRIGATTTHSYLERDPELQRVLPVLGQIEHRVANARVRAVGTLGGNLAFGEPHSDPATFLVAAEARYVLITPEGGQRTVPASEFLVGPFEPSLAAAEVITEVDVPLLPGRVFGYQRFVLTERPAANVAVRLDVDDGTLDGASVVVGAATAFPVDVVAAGGLLRGVSLTPATALISSVAEAVAESFEPERGADAGYLRPLVATLTRRALGDAFAQARLVPLGPYRGATSPKSWRDRVSSALRHGGDALFHRA